jgi:hypothetical protein
MFSDMTHILRKSQGLEASHEKLGPTPNNRLGSSNPFASFLLRPTNPNKSEIMYRSIRHFFRHF